MESTKNHARKAGALFLSGFAALALQIPLASAADFGMGVAFEGSGSTVMVPIKTNTLLIEPQLQFDNSSATGSTFKNINPGVGVYLRKELGPLFESYMGGRVAYDQNKQTFPGGDFKSTSFSLGPTFGVQHFFSKQFSLGLDASLIYTNGKQTSSGQPDVHFHSLSTETRVLLRAFF